VESIVNYTIGVLGLILAIVGIYLTIKSNKKKEPVYSIKSNNLISDYASKYKNLNVSYNRKKVENITISKILFYNRGAETITQDDIYLIKNRPRIVPKEGVKILDASILQTNNPSSEIHVPETPLRDNNEVLIWFKYLDQNQGAIYQVIHTGLSSEALDVRGDIIGVQKLVKVPPDKFKPPPNLRTSLFAILLRLLFMIPTIGFILIFGEPLNLRLLLIFTMILFVVFDFIPLVFRVMKGSSVPKGLEKFNE
jgi:hypothetical protein